VFFHDVLHMLATNQSRDSASSSVAWRPKTLILVRPWHRRQQQHQGPFINNVPRTRQLSPWHFRRRDPSIISIKPAMPRTLPWATKDNPIVRDKRPRPAPRPQEPAASSGDDRRDRIKNSSSKSMKDTRKRSSCTATGCTPDCTC
jgi:hypothetical protein